MANQGTVGANAQGGLSKNTAADERLDPSAALVTTDGHARYQEALFTGNCFTACNQSGKALSAITSASATGFVLTNPVASGKNIVLIDCAMAQDSAPAGISAIMYCYNASATAVTHTTPLTVRNAFLSGNGAQTSIPSVGIGLVDDTATVPTAAVAVRAMPGGPVATGGVNVGFTMDPIDGKLILSPGSYIHLAYITTALTAITSMLWEEVPLVSVR